MENILSLNRNTANRASFNVIESLTYNYTSLTNRLNTISDFSNNGEGFNTNGASTGYSYDLNGNIYTDPYKKINGAKYYFNNLPKTIPVTGGGNIKFTYDASGRKLRKEVLNTNNAVQLNQDYVGNIEYKNGLIEAIYNSEGRAVLVAPNTWRYEYNIKDHLGNVRAVVSDLNNNGILDITKDSTTNEVINRYDYYPFGMVMNNNNLTNNPTTPDTKYQYNGKEMNSDLGLNLLDYGARWYDATIGIFHGVDAWAEKYPSWSPFVYTMNNPIKYIDPTGNGTESTHTDQDGNVIAVYDDGDHGVYKHEKNADGSSVTRNQLDKRHSKSNSAGGTKMGETEFIDEFRRPGTNIAEGKIEFGTTWGPLIKWGNDLAKNQDLSITMEDSKNKAPLDIKESSWAHSGVMTGRKMPDGMYATARSAGNYLAGLNGVTGTFQGQKISGETYMKLAGAYQLGQLSSTNAARIVTFGTSFGPAPYYGEIPYTGRMVLKGIQSINLRP